MFILETREAKKKTKLRGARCFFRSQMGRVQQFLTQCYKHSLSTAFQNAPSLSTKPLALPAWGLRLVGLLPRLLCSRFHTTCSVIALDANTGNRMSRKNFV